MNKRLVPSNLRAVAREEKDTSLRYVLREIAMIVDKLLEELDSLQKENARLKSNEK